MSLPIFLLLFFCFIASVSPHFLSLHSSQNLSSQIPTTSPQSDFLTIVTAILGNQETLSDNPNHLSTFAYWQGSFSNKTIGSKHAKKIFIQDFFDFPVTNGLVSEYWSHTPFMPNSWNIYLQIYNGNYTDRNGLILEVQNDPNVNPFEINQTNA